MHVGDVNEPERRYTVRRVVSPAGGIAADDRPGACRAAAWSEQQAAGGGDLPRPRRASRDQDQSVALEHSRPMTRRKDMLSSGLGAPVVERP